MHPWPNSWANAPPPAWYQPNAHPHVYVPPQSQYPRPPAGYWEQSAWNRPSEMPPAPQFNEYRSKYPNLNPILAADTTLVRFDVQKKPRSEILASTYYTNRQALATTNPVKHIRLFSKAFPWAIDIKSPSPITCEGVWDAIYVALQEPIVDSEWGLIMHDKDRKKTIETAAKKREERDRDKRLKRIDWLGEHTLFKGLETDDDFQKNRLFPGSQTCSETYLVKFGQP